MHTYVLSTGCKKKSVFSVDRIVQYIKVKRVYGYAEIDPSMIGKAANPNFSLFLSHRSASRVETPYVITVVKVKYRKQNRLGREQVNVTICRLQYEKSII